MAFIRGIYAYVISIKIPLLAKVMFQLYNMFSKYLESILFLRKVTMKSILKLHMYVFSSASIQLYECIVLCYRSNWRLEELFHRGNE